MVNGFDDSALERLKQAETVEREMQRLQPLAAEAPQLRLQKIKALRDEDRQRTKDGAMSRAKNATQADHRCGRLFLGHGVSNYEIGNIAIERLLQVTAPQHAEIWIELLKHLLDLVLSMARGQGVGESAGVPVQ